MNMLGSAVVVLLIISTNKSEAAMNNCSTQTTLLEQAKIITTAVKRSLEDEICGDACGCVGPKLEELVSLVNELNGRVCGDVCLLEPKCGHGWTYYNGHCYTVLRDFTWNAAKDFCIQMGAQLASIHSAEENKFVYELVLKELGMLPCNGDIIDYHTQTAIGLHLPQGTRIPEWVDGSNVDYTNWMNGEPNNLNERESCGVIYTSAPCGPRYLKKWNDSLCNRFVFRSAVCKRGEMNA